MEQSKSVTELEPNDWAEMPLDIRLMNYIQLVEYNYQLQHKNIFKYEITDKSAVRAIVDIISEGKYGLLIAGERGSGKTLLMRMLQKCLEPAKRFRMINTIDVVGDFKADGEESLHKYLGKNILFDDLGFEQKGVHFGDKVDCIDFLTYKRYEEFTFFDPERHTSPVLTFFSTNLTPAQIEERYDQRTIDRMMGMCKLVDFQGESHRLKMYHSIQLPNIFPIHYGMGVAPVFEKVEFAQEKKENGIVKKGGVKMDWKKEQPGLTDDEVKIYEYFDDLWKEQHCRMDMSNPRNQIVEVESVDMTRGEFVFYAKKLIDNPQEREK